MKSRVVSNRVFSFVIIGAILISLFSFSDAFAAQTVNDRKVINSTSIVGGITNEDLFGYQIESIGDLDEDGITDLATIKFSANFTGASAENNVGSILILFMNSDGTVKSTNEIVMDGTASGLNGCIANDSTNRDTGSLEQLAFVGHLDSDNKPTLALGANSNDHDVDGVGPNGIVIDTGAVYMLELNTNGTVDNCVLITEDNGGFAPADGVYQEDAAANFGWPVIATDLNGDGQNELLVGANSESNLQTDLWPLFLTEDGDVASHPNDPISGLTIGIDSNEFMAGGKSISGTKIVVSNENDGDGGGSVFIVNLSAAGALVSSTEILGSEIAGIANDERFGSGVTPLGDMDGDGINDILVGNEAGDDINALSGEVHILFLNADDTLKESQKISNESENTRTGSEPFSASDIFGHGMNVWLSSSTEVVIAIGATQNDDGGSNRGAIHLFYIERTPISVIKKGGGGCDDCTPPTLGVNSHGERMVDGGFSYNGNIVDVKHFYTEFPLITTTTEKLNSVQVKIYENGGIANNKWIQFGLGVKQVRSPVNDSEVIILVNLHNNGTAVESIDITNKQNLIEEGSVFATVYPIKCKVHSNNEDCILVTLVYSYREAPQYNIMLVNTVDDKRNSWNFYFNDGIKVIGKSLNEPPTSKQFFKNASQDKDVWYTLTRTDKINDIWTDQNGIEYQNNNGAFDRITPHEPLTCNDPPLDQINVPTRMNCNFRALTTIWG